jgi:hypothetical protein
MPASNPKAEKVSKTKQDQSKAGDYIQEVRTRGSVHE